MVHPVAKIIMKSALSFSNANGDGSGAFLIATLSALRKCLSMDVKCCKLQRGLSKLISYYLPNFVLPMLMSAVMNVEDLE